MEPTTTIETDWLQDRFAELLSAINETRDELNLFREETRDRFDRLEGRFYVSEQVTETVRRAVKESGEILGKV